MQNVHGCYFTVVTKMVFEYDIFKLYTINDAKNDLLHSTSPQTINKVRACHRAIME